MIQNPDSLAKRASQPCMARKLRVLAFLAATSMALSQPVYLNPRDYPLHTDGLFPADAYVLSQATFLYKLFSEVDDDEALVYDYGNPRIVLARISFRGLGPDEVSDSLRAAKLSLQHEIEVLLTKSPSARSARERTLDAAFPADWDSARKKASLDRLKVKRGQRRTFMRSLANSSSYLPMIDSVFREMGVPVRLKYLPHVESSFRNLALSSAGAAGLWQIIPIAGREQGLLSEQWDGRLDPLAATEAAGRILHRDVKRLGDWSLAVMAYNHGAGGIAKAMRKLGTRDYSILIREFQGERFKTASRFYYAKFLAFSSLAMAHESNHERSGTTLRAPHRVIAHSWSPFELQLLTGISVRQLQAANPHLKLSIFYGNESILPGARVYLPEDPQRRSAAARTVLAFGPAEKRVMRHQIHSLPPAEQMPALPNEQQILESLIQKIEQGSLLTLAAEDELLLDPHPFIRRFLEMRSLTLAGIDNSHAAMESVSGTTDFHWLKPILRDLRLFSTPDATVRASLIPLAVPLEEEPLSL